MLPGAMPLLSYDLESLKSIYSPTLQIKTFRCYKQSIKKIVFNSDKSLFGLLWKTMVEDVEIRYYNIDKAKT